jgi:uncharacterized protein YjbJ (UPF0337 family)
MSNASKRAEGAAEELGGKIKRAAGKLTGNKTMEAQGNARIAEGEAKQAAAKAGERVKGTGEKAIGAIKNRTGALVDNESLEAEGRAEELKGEARKQANR